MTAGAFHVIVVALHQAWIIHPLHLQFSSELLSTQKVSHKQKLENGPHSDRDGEAETESGRAHETFCSSSDGKLRGRKLYVDSTKRQRLKDEVGFSCRHLSVFLPQCQQYKWPFLQILATMKCYKDQSYCGLPHHQRRLPAKYIQIQSSAAVLRLEWHTNCFSTTHSESVRRPNAAY